MDLIAQKEIVRAERGPATEFEVGTHALSWSFSYTNHRYTSYNPSAYIALSVPVMGVPLSSGCLRPTFRLTCMPLVWVCPCEVAAGFPHRKTTSRRRMIWAWSSLATSCSEARWHHESVVVRCVRVCVCMCVRAIIMYACERGWSAWAELSYSVLTELDFWMVILCVSNSGLTFLSNRATFIVPTINVPLSEGQNLWQEF